MTKLRSHIGAAAAALALALGAASAQADTVWHFTYAGNGVSAGGSFQTVGNGSSPTAIEWISGSYSDQFTTNAAISLIPVTSTVWSPGEYLSADGQYYYNDMFNSASGFDDGGVLFHAGSQEVNLYFQNGMFNIDSGVTTAVTFKAVAVPEPGPIAMLLAGLGALAFVSRRKTRG